MRRWWLVVAGFGVGLALVPPAHAASGGVGWWTRSPVASAPEGGAAVASAPDGPTSVAAILVDLRDGVTSARLTLRQSSATAPATANVEACVVSAFTPAAGGPIANAPATACRGASVPVVAADDGITWRADLSDLVVRRTGTVGVAIVPTRGQRGVWELQFDQADVAVVEADASASPPAIAPPPSATQPTATSSPELATFTPTSAPEAVDPTSAASGPHSSATAVDDGSASRAGTSRPAAATPAGGGNPLAYVVLAAVVGIVGGFAHRAATGRVPASRRQVAS